MEPKKTKTVEEKKSAMIEGFCNVLNRHIKEPEEVHGLIRSILNSSEYLLELSGWNRSWIISISRMRKIITAQNDEKLSNHFSTIADSFIEGMMLGRESSNTSKLLYKMEEEFEAICDDYL